MRGRRLKLVRRDIRIGSRGNKLLNGGLQVQKMKGLDRVNSALRQPGYEDSKYLLRLHHVRSL